jgi:hypothetical protein
VKIEDVWRERAVRCVLEGSVRRAGDNVRSTAQLIEMATGAPLVEAERERMRRKPTEGQNACGAFAKRRHHFGRLRARDRAEARRWFEQNFIGERCGDREIIVAKRRPIRASSRRLAGA